MSARGMSAGERKNITVLFADIVGSTALMSSLDPEEARSRIDPVLNLIIESVHHFEGFVAKSLGDGILALFGAPIAHEDHPQRALFAALRMLDRVKRLHKGTLQIRIGINTGDVVLRAIHLNRLHADYDPVGNTMNVASRVQQLAAPGTVFVTETTYRATEGYFEFESVGTKTVRGLGEDLPVYRLLGLGPLRTRFQYTARRGLAGFVGRQKELGLLQRCLEELAHGQGRVIGIVGEAGVGKSRLLHEVKRRAQRFHGLMLEASAVSYGQAFPGLPLIDLLRHYFQIRAGDENPLIRHRVISKIRRLDPDLEEWQPYLLFVLGGSELAPELETMSPLLRRRRTLDAIRGLLERESRQQPLILLFEDLQWLDSETRDFLDDFVAGLAEVPILLLATYRPEFRHEWHSLAGYRQLQLGPLPASERAELADELLGKDASVQPLKSRLLETSEGNPFFLEELIQGLIEQGILLGTRGNYRLARPGMSLELPNNVQAVLAARMDRLQTEDKALLQTLAVIGHEFPLSLALHVVDGSEDHLRRQLVVLQEEGFIYERPAFPEVEYRFKHALTEQVAYNSLLGEQKRELHARAGRAIEQLYEGHLEEHYSELAHHYGRSGVTAKAVHYLRGAGQQALRRGAHREALGHLKSALERLTDTPETSERNREELSLLLALGSVWMAMKGYAASEVEETYSRALTLCELLKDESRLFTAIFGLRRFYHVRGDFAAAFRCETKLLELAEQQQSSAESMEANFARGATLLHLGELEASRDLLQKAIALYDPARHREHSALYGLDPAITAYSLRGYVLWYLGFPDQAVNETDKAINLARQQSFPYELAYALVMSADVHRYCGQAEQMRALLDTALTLTVEHDFQYWHAWTQILQGWLRFATGDDAKAVQDIENGLQAFMATGSRFWVPHYQGLLAGLYGRIGAFGRGLELAGEALDAAERSQDLICQPELLRTLGQLHEYQALEASRSSPDWSQAHDFYSRAIEMAGRQGARSVQLRAAISLVRLSKRTGDSSQALGLLGRIYASFTEGFTTAGLREAHALLDPTESSRSDSSD